MRTVLWWVGVGAGILIMCVAYRADRPAEAMGPWGEGVIEIAKTASQSKEEHHGFPSEKIRVRQLPLGGYAETLAREVENSDRELGRRLAFQCSEKLIDGTATESDLSWGRLPQVGHDEIVAGCRATTKSQIVVAGRTLTVVGGLRREAALLTNCYLIPCDASCRGLFESKDEAVRQAYLVHLAPDQLADSQVREKLKSAFPQDKFFSIPSVVYAEPGSYLGYLSGLALVCFCGSGGLIRLYAAAAPRVRWRVLREPLMELSNHRRLLWSVHIVYFGLYFLGALIIYQLPTVQNMLGAAMSNQIQSQKGPLGVAGTAYATKSIPFAALVTFAVNFFLGSLLVLTLPSCVIPGSGALMAAVRAFFWGIALAPSSRLLAYAMIPHSVTLLFEGEGYILATFFGLFIPIFLLRRNLGPSLFGRYRRGIALNLKGSLLVALVLAVAAVYEATEVIWMMK